MTSRDKAERRERILCWACSMLIFLGILLCCWWSRAECAECERALVISVEG